VILDSEALTALDPPFAVVDLDAFDANLEDLLRRANGKPLRLASKSLRVRDLQARALAGGFRGMLCFTLPEALWLASLGHTDLVVGYPTVDRAALRQLSDHDVTVMVDCREHLAPLPPGTRVCVDVDAGFWALGGRVRIGAKRSPLHTPEQVVALVRELLARGLVLDGLMAYEGQIAGVGDRPPGRRFRGAAIRTMQRRSAAELAERRAAVVAAIREFAELPIVNGGGTGSLELTGVEDAVTEVAAGSGFYAPALFDHYSRFSLTPAAGFALPIVRKPAAGVATALGGGYLASGSGDSARLPSPWLPAGLELDAEEGAGEVQTPLSGPPARDLQIGDRVYMRHAKAGELCERFDALHLVEGEEIVDVVPTYRGEGKAFL